MNAVWLVPTARAIDWWPLAAVAALLAGTALLADMPVGGFVAVAAAALAAAVVAGLRDPAAALLAAVPTSVAVRRARRLVLLLPVELAIAVSSRLDVPLAGLAALTATGIAVAFWSGPVAGVAVPLGWVMVARAGGLDWDQHTSLVTIAALAALWTGRNR